MVWEQDITDLYPALEKEAYIGIFIDTWTAEGYVVGLDIEVKESKISCDALPKRHVQPLINTVIISVRLIPIYLPVKMWQWILNCLVMQRMSV